MTVGPLGRRRTGSSTTPRTDRSTSTSCSRRDVRELMGEVAELLGRAPMPPRWALGFLQSTRHFDDTAELRRLPRTIREKRIPCDALI